MFGQLSSPVDDKLPATVTSPAKEALCVFASPSQLIVSAVELLLEVEFRTEPSQKENFAGYALAAVGSCLI